VILRLVNARSLASGAALAALLAGLALAPPAAGGVPCSIVAVGIDTSQATSSASPLLGEAPGQTFFARDTLIHSLTVWRIASEDTNLFGMHLYITRADSTGKPLLDQIVLNGPTLYNPYGDGIHPVPFQWLFDPPLTLPGTGHYAFFLALSPCILGYFDVLGRESQQDLFPDGSFWWTGRSADCSLIGLNNNPVADLVFALEFCDTHSTPVLRKTWGELKARYH